MTAVGSEMVTWGNAVLLVFAGSIGTGETWPSPSEWRVAVSAGPARAAATSSTRLKDVLPYRKAPNQEGRRRISRAIRRPGVAPIVVPYGSCYAVSDC